MISVIVPIYKTEEYLNRCVDSILTSTYEDIEVILVDDGSPDNAGKICDEYAEKDARVRVIHKENGGLSSARNAGLAIAKGDYITFVDSDDTIRIDAIEKMLSVATSEGAAIVKMKFKKVFENESTDRETAYNGVPEYKKISNADYIKAICTYRASCSFCDKIFKREVLLGRSFNEERTNEDLLLLATILLESDYDVYELDYEGYFYLSRENSITKTKFGRAITDTVYNSRELVELSEKIRPEFSVYFKGLLLYQSRTFLLLMPKTFIKEKPESYRLAYESVRRNRKYINGAFFAKRDKRFLKAFLLFPALVKKIVGER